MNIKQTAAAPNFSYKSPKQSDACNSTSESIVLGTQTTIASGKAAWAGRQASYDYYKCSFLQV